MWTVSFVFDKIDYMICLGPAGTAGMGYFNGLQKVHDLGLTAMEVEFTYGVRMSNRDAEKIGRLAGKLDVTLSVHAPYYINLASSDKVKLAASKERILKSCEKAHFLGAKYVVFHAGFYQSRNEKEVYNLIKKELFCLQKDIEKHKWGVVLAPEVTGKKTQFGSLDELLKLRREIGTELCVDFAHILAREGAINFSQVFDKLKGLNFVHAHYSGIEYTQKGEKKHIITKEKDISSLLQEAVKNKFDITIINESPDPMGDSVKTKKMLKKLERKLT